MMLLHTEVRESAGNAPLSSSVMEEHRHIPAGAHPMSAQGFERVQGLRRRVDDTADCREGNRAFKHRRVRSFRGQ